MFMSLTPRKVSNFKTEFGNFHWFLFLDDNQHITKTPNIDWVESNRLSPSYVAVYTMLPYRFVYVLTSRNKTRTLTRTCRAGRYCIQLWWRHVITLHTSETSLMLRIVYQQIIRRDPALLFQREMHVLWARLCERPDWLWSAWIHIIIHFWLLSAFAMPISEIIGSKKTLTGPLNSVNMAIELCKHGH